MSTAERLEELRDLPRVTAEQRERYDAWEVACRVELDLCETKDFFEERRRLRQARAFGQVPMPESPNNEWPMRAWISYWRSLPDYSGPPMRAPSGVRWARDYETGLLNAQMSLCFGLIWWHKHIRGLEDGVRCDDGRKDEHGVVRYANWYMENSGATRMITDCLNPPSKGGRGWCPGLAGVGK